MDPNNLSGITIDDNLLDESDYSAVSSVGTDLKQILEKIKQLETKVAQNNEPAGQTGINSSSIAFQIGEKFGEFEELKNEVEKFGQEIQKLAGENEKMKKEFAEKHAEMKEDFERKINQKDCQIHKIKEENGKLAQEVKKLADELAEKDLAMDGLKNGMAEKNDENIRLKIEIAGQKVENAKLEDNNRAMQRKIERIETYFPKMKKVLINRRALPADGQFSNLAINLRPN